VHSTGVDGGRGAAGPAGKGSSVAGQMSGYSVGVEEEYQLVDPHSGELRSSARVVLQGDWSGEIRTELQDSTIEIGTSVCESSTGILRELRRLRAQSAAAAAAEELQIVAAGLHPFANWREHTLSADERYRRIAETYGRIARDEHNFGMHIHVAVEGDRMRILGRIRRYIPHLLALSCSSPFHEGEDTAYDSYRMVLWRRWPGAAPPPLLQDDVAYRRYVDVLLDAGVLPDERSLYWMIRRHPAYPTVEFRMCDVCPSLADAVAIAGVARTLVYAAGEGMLPGSEPWKPAVADLALADECWRASRYGLDAQLLRDARSNEWDTAREAVARLAELLRPAAEELGEAAALDAAVRLAERGNAAARTRAFYRECRDMAHTVRWLAAETVVGAGMDRRTRQRAGADTP
jgi:glutamate---cysteine ligase / carboxylate-amine ligase